MLEGDNMQESHEIFGEVISSYSRAQAIEDGVLVDVSEVAREAGVRFPVALTQRVWAEYVKPDDRSRPYGQSEDGRLWDTLWMFAQQAKRSSGSEIRFKCYYIQKERQKRLVELKAICGPGDTPMPVITILCLDED